MRNSNNMKNITNKTKTILFASLIAAMVVPFNGMNYATAEADPLRALFLEKINEERNKQTMDSSSLRALNVGLQVYDLQNELEVLIATDNVDESEIVAQKLMKAQNVLKLLAKNVDAYDMNKNAGTVESPDTTAPIALQANLSNKWATLGEKDVCGFTHAVASTGGFVTAHLSGVWMNGGISYPSTIDTGSWPFCGSSSKILNFDDALETYYPITTPTGTCYHTFNTNTALINEYCPYIHNGDIVSVWTDALYTHPTNPNLWSDFNITQVGFMAVDFGGN